MFRSQIASTVRENGRGLDKKMKSKKDFFGKTNIFSEKCLTKEKKYGILRCTCTVRFFFLCAFCLKNGSCEEPNYYVNTVYDKHKEVLFMRTRITLACSECKQRNYNTMKNKKNDPDRIEMSKYCRFCKKHTLHKETK